MSETFKNMNNLQIINTVNKHENQIEGIGEQLADITQIKIANNIADTSYVANMSTDVSYLKTLQAQNIAIVSQKSKNDESILIDCEGDSLSYGYDISSNDKRNPPTDILPDGSTHKTTRAGKTYPEALEEFLNIVYPGKITVENRGYSGDYCSKSLTRWNKKNNSDLVLIMLGTNDSRSTSCPYVGNVKEYIYWYEQLIIRELLWGKAIVIIKSPRTLQANDMDVESFKSAIVTLASKYDIPLIDSTPILSSYNYDIWSDVTDANVNKITTHLNTKGYTILGAGVASELIGKIFIDSKKVNSGDTLLFREQVDGIKYISNALNLEVTPNYTPFERTDNKSIICRMGEGGKIIYSFYTETEDLVVIPTIYTYANKKFKMILDFGVEQPYLNLITKSLTPIPIGTKIPSIVDLTTVSNWTYRKSTMVDSGVLPLRIVRKGWHTLIIECDNSILSGLEFLNYNDWDALTKRFRVKSDSASLSIKYDEKYGEIIGKINVSMPTKINILELTTIPSNFKILNKFVSVTNKSTESYASIYTESDGKTYIEVTNNGTLSDLRVAVVDYRLFGYYI